MAIQYYTDGEQKVRLPDGVRIIPVNDPVFKQVDVLYDVVIPGQTVNGDRTEEIVALEERKTQYRNQYYTDIVRYEYHKKGIKIIDRPVYYKLGKDLEGNTDEWVVLGKPYEDTTRTGRKFFWSRKRRKQTTDNVLSAFANEDKNEKADIKVRSVFTDELIAGQLTQGVLSTSTVFGLVKKNALYAVQKLSDLPAMKPETIVWDDADFIKTIDVNTESSGTFNLLDRDLISKKYGVVGRTNMIKSSEEVYHFDKTQAEIKGEIIATDSSIGNEVRRSYYLAYSTPFGAVAEGVYWSTEASSAGLDIKPAERVNVGQLTTRLDITGSVQQDTHLYLTASLHYTQNGARGTKVFTYKDTIQKSKRVISTFDVWDEKKAYSVLTNNKGEYVFSDNVQFKKTNPENTYTFSSIGRTIPTWIEIKNNNLVIQGDMITPALKTTTYEAIVNELENGEVVNTKLVTLTIKGNID